MRRLTIRTSALLLGSVLLAAAPAQAEMLTFATPNGNVSWPKLPTVADWHDDEPSSLRDGADTLVPDGFEFTDADAIIQAKGFSRSGGSVTSLEQLQGKDRAASPDTQVQNLPDIADKDGKAFHLLAFSPAGAGRWKNHRLFRRRRLFSWLSPSAQSPRLLTTKRGRSIPICSSNMPRKFPGSERLAAAQRHATAPCRIPR